MKTWLNVAGLIAAFSLLSPPLSAQWPDFATSGVPKTKSGQPDLSAPAPRTPDGKRDLSGLWANGTGGPGDPNASISGTGGSPPPPGAPPRPAGGGGAPVSQFFDIGARLKDGLPLQPWAAELKKKRMADHSKDNPDALCLPMGNMQLHTHPQPRKIIQTPKVIVILYEGNSGIRQIFTDGRPLPDNDPQPWWYGYSVGKWEGDTLVVQTTGFRDDGWLDVNGSPLTEAAKMTERFRRVNFGTLEIEVTIDDPKAYTKPFTATVTQRIMLDTELIEFICGENDRSASDYKK